MKPGMKMLMLSDRNRGSDGEGEFENNRIHSPGSQYNGLDGVSRHGGYKLYPDGGRGPVESDYGRFRGYPEYDGWHDGAETRFRDRRGREHYDNGRYAPMNDMDDDEMENRWNRRESAGNNYGDMAYHGSPYVPPVYDEGNKRTMNRIGFAVGEEVGNNYRTMVEYPRMNEMDHKAGEYVPGHSSSKAYPKFTKELAEEWTSGMENEDGTKGPHWTLEQAKQVMAQRNIDCDPLEFWAVLNAVYSDYSALAKRHNVNSMDFYADMAKAWLSDKDAMDGKAARYFEHIVRH